MERSVLVAGLREVDPAQPFGEELSGEVFRLTVVPTREAVCLRRHAGRVQVYLVQNPSDDPRSPNLWENPGTIIRPRESEADSFARLERGKFGGKFGAWDLVGVFDNPTYPRCHFSHQVYVVEVAQEGRGQWFFVDELPPMVPYHRDGLLALARKKF